MENNPIFQKRANGKKSLYKMDLNPLTAVMDAKHIPTLGRMIANHRGMKLSTISTEVAKAGHVFKNLENGRRSVTIRKYDEFLSWFSEHWPDDLDWPSDIPRPSPKREDAA